MSLSNEQNHQLSRVLNAFVDLINDWNDLKDDGDRGRGNEALYLELFDDGTGRLGTCSRFKHELFTNPQFEFGHPDELVKYLDDWLEFDRS